MTSATIPATTGLSRGDVRGRAVGVAMLAVFGFSWAGWATSAVPAAVAVPGLSAAALFSLTCLGGAVLMYRRAGSLYADHDAARDRAAGQRFGIIVTVEFAALFIIARVLAGVGQTQLVPMLVCLGVGIHFFPLRRLFGVPIYDRTGAALCLVAVATAALAPMTGSPSLWTILPGFGAAVALYATCAALIRANISHPPQRDAAGTDNAVRNHRPKSPTEA